MKSNLKKLVEASEKLCAILDVLRDSEESDYAELIMHLERYKLQANSMKNNLTNLEMELNHVL